jgi:hypothetical protein
MRDKITRTTPKTAWKEEIFWDSFLIFFVEILAKVSTGAHFPFEKVGRMSMKFEVLWGFPCNSVPNRCKLLTQHSVRRNGKIKVKMWHPSFLEFQNPQIGNGTPPEELQKGVEVGFNGSTVWGCLVVGETIRRNQGSFGISSRKFKP